MGAEMLQQKSLARVMRQRLNAHDPAGRKRSQQIVRRIVESPAWREASRVLMFAPMPVEPDLDLLWRERGVSRQTGRLTRAW